MGTAKPLPPSDQIRELLHYDPLNGVFTWRVNKRGRGARVGALAGTWKPDGYLSIMIDGKRYPAQRLAWKIVTGEEPGPVVDHRDGDTHNNAFLNLRNADLGKNAHNSDTPSTNSSGFKGVSYHQRTGRFQAQVMVEGRYFHFGYFETAEAANDAVRVGREHLHADFACHGRCVA